MNLGFRNMTLYASLLPLLLACFLGGGMRSLAQSSLDFSCSTFPKDLTEGALIARFGAENVKNALVTAFDDGPQNGTVLFADQADAKLEIIWNDSISKSRPAWVRVQGEVSRRKPSVGLMLGTTLRAIEQANGKPFRLAGFGTEGQGRILSWSNGRLETASGAACLVSFYVQPRWDGTDDSSSMRQLASGKAFSSGHPAMQKLNPKLSVFTIRYPN